MNTFDIQCSHILHGCSFLRMPSLFQSCERLKSIDCSLAAVDRHYRYFQSPELHGRGAMVVDSSPIVF